MRISLIIRVFIIVFYGVLKLKAVLNILERLQVYISFGESYKTLSVSKNDLWHKR